MLSYSPMGSKKRPNKQTMKTIFIQDAAIDEYIAGVLLSTFSSLDLQQIIILHGDCVAGPAMDAAWRIQQYTRQATDILSLAHSRSWNPFPWEYRKDSVALNHIPCLRDIPANPEWPWYPSRIEAHLPYHQLADLNANHHPMNEAHHAYPDGDLALTEKLQEALNHNEKLLLVVCCPLTLVASVLQANPHLEAAIDHMVWMGGAVNGVPGNLDPDTLPRETASPYAEWNVFCDPYAVAWIFANTCFPITLFPLNVTNQAALTPAFLEGLAQQAASAPLSRLAWESYQLVLDQPFYSLWDVTTVVYLERPDLFSAPQTQSLSIITDGFYQGTLIPSDSGRALQVIMDICDPAAFYEYLLQQLNR